MHFPILLEALDFVTTSLERLSCEKEEEGEQEEVEEVIWEEESQALALLLSLCVIFSCRSN